MGPIVKAIDVTSMGMGLVLLYAWHGGAGSLGVSAGERGISCGGKHGVCVSECVDVGECSFWPSL